MKLFVYIVLAVMAFELAQAYTNKESPTAVQIMYRSKAFPSNKIRLSDNSRLSDVGLFFRKMKNNLKEIMKVMRSPVYKFKGKIFGRKQHWNRHGK